MFAGGDHDADGDLGELDSDAGGPDAHDVPHHGDVSGLAFIFLSLRFWTFFSTFFGLTGFVLSMFRLVEGAGLILGLSVAMGGVLGCIAALVINRMTQSEVGAVATSADYVGQSARVLLPFGKGDLGKVRLQLRGTTVDVLATTDESDGFAVDEQALIVEMQDTTAYVARVSARDRQS